MNAVDMLAEIARLRADNEALRAAKAKAVTLKVSEKGALSLYGLGRFPVTLYKGQWQRLLGQAKAIEAFLADHAGELATKE